jgi:hypothetical protein
LRKIAKRRAGLDAEEAHWLREAERSQIWRELGMTSALDYMERVLGYLPHTAQERLRVATLLGELPVITEALAQGQLSYCAVRELTRIVTPSTESAWCDFVTDKNLRQIEKLVSEHRLGDRPDDPPIAPEVRAKKMRIEMSAETFALWRQAHQILDDEHGHRLSDDEFVATLCAAVLERGGEGEPNGRAKFQIAMTVCKRCQQGWQEGAGVQVAVAASTVERAYCDAQEIGSIDGAEPERARQEVPPSMMRLVWRRDDGHCRVPGCRSSRVLEVHHIVHREHGGSHEASNLILLCSACHSAHHRGTLQISGTASQLEVERTAEAEQYRKRLQAQADDDSHGAHEHAPARNRSHDARDHALARDHSHVGPSRTQDSHDAHDLALARNRSHVGPNSTQDSHSAHDLAPACDHALDRDHSHVGPSCTRDSHDARDHAPARDRSHVGPHRGRGSRWNTMLTCKQAKDALVGMGWKPKIAAAAVQAAASALGEEPAIERLIFEALRRCPRPVS